MTVVFEGILKKMQSTFARPVQYSLCDVALNPHIGRELRLQFTGEKYCIYCQRKINKTFGQGYCFPCFSSLARCDACIVQPEKCHFHKGTCREPEWGKEHCLIPHSIYLAASNSLKIGITRKHQKLTRWIDQGAFSALEVAVVDGRLASGLAEMALKEEYSERTDWRGLLTGRQGTFDLLAERERLLEDFMLVLDEVGATPSEDSAASLIEYPVNEYLQKAKTANLDKEASVEGIFHGIRGQYLLVGEVGLNIRKYQGYSVRIEV